MMFGRLSEMRDKKEELARLVDSGKRKSKYKRGQKRTELTVRGATLVSTKKKGGCAL